MRLQSGSPRYLNQCPIGAERAPLRAPARVYPRPASLNGGSSDELPGMVLNVARVSP
jgi:hypothetical protein